MKQRPTAACSCQGLGHSEQRGNRKDPPAHSASLYTCVYPYLRHYCDDMSWNVGTGTAIGQIGEECQHDPLDPTRDDPPKARPEHIHATHQKPHPSARTKLYRHKQKQNQNVSSQTHDNETKRKEKKRNITNTRQNQKQTQSRSLSIPRNFANLILPRGFVKISAGFSLPGT